jgi:predicted RNase H-like HicB family nuclease
MKRSGARKTKMQLTAVISTSPEGGFVAFNPETGMTTQGETVDEALLNLKEATELYLEETPTVALGKSLVTTIEVASHA